MLPFHLGPKHSKHLLAIKASQEEEGREGRGGGGGGREAGMDMTERVPQNDEDINAVQDLSVAKRDSNRQHGDRLSSAFDEGKFSSVFAWHICASVCLCLFVCLFLCLNVCMCVSFSS